MECRASDNRLDRASDRNLLRHALLVHLPNAVGKRCLGLILASKAPHTGSFSSRRAKVKALFELTNTANTTLGHRLRDPLDEGIVPLVDLWKHIIVVDHAVRLPVKAAHRRLHLNLDTHVLLKQEITVITSMVESILPDIWRA